VQDSVHSKLSSTPATHICKVECYSVDNEVLGGRGEMKLPAPSHLKPPSSAPDSRSLVVLTISATSNSAITTRDNSKVGYNWKA
jgi:hypothetical protein